MNILSFLNIKNISIILGISFFSYSLYAIKQNIELKADKQRLTDNVSNALKIDSLETTIFKIKKESELLEILNQNKTLQTLVKKSEIKAKRVENLYYQELSYREDTPKQFDVSDIVPSIRENTPIIKQWEDVSSCVKVSGNVTYQNDSLTVNVLNKEFKDSIALIKSKGRRKPIKWLLNLRLGERENVFTPEASCSDIKVTVIEKQ